MTRRQDLERHREGLREVRDIMNSMKTLAFMETRKLARILDAQQTVVASIEEIASDFLNFHADTLPEICEAVPVYLLIGTERGFCGDFNRAVVHQIESALEVQSNGEPVFIAIGHKMHTLLEDDMRVAARIEGASVVEEVTAVINPLVEALSLLQERHGMLAVYGVYQDVDTGVVLRKLSPPFEQCLQQPRTFANPPVLQLSPSRFLMELTDQYLFAALHAMLVMSLMAENHKRMTHLDGAVRHLDEQSDDLARRCSALRQEEIIEEIEVILLSADSLDASGHEIQVLSDLGPEAAKDDT